MILITILLILSFIASVTYAQPRYVMEDEALAAAQQHFVDKQVDYYILDDESTLEWHIFVDAEPSKGWWHDCFMVYVPKNPSKADNTTKIEKLDKFPAGNFKPLLLNSLTKNDNSVSEPQVQKTNISESQASIASNTYALIINGGGSKLSNYISFWNSCSFIYKVLVNKYGIPKENITPIMADGNDSGDDTHSNGSYISQNLDLDGDGTDDIHLAATKENIESTIKSISKIIKEGEHLFIFVADHGLSKDNIASSVICLWDNEELTDTELAEMLLPINRKNAYISFVLGQCYSGGFIEELVKNMNPDDDKRCIVATACRGDEASSIMSKPQYPEFLYKWTCAMNEADHKGNPVASDANGDGRVSMKEAFEYAANHNYANNEIPQYGTTHSWLGEELAFHYIPEYEDLYIRDNEEDTGVEPNLTTNISWASPDIWNRNNDDGGTEHENPHYSQTHKSSTIHVRVTNRNHATYMGGQYLHACWMVAYTAITPPKWRESTGIITDDKAKGRGDIGTVAIPAPLAPGESVVLKMDWQYPEAMNDASLNESGLFTILSYIDKNDDMTGSAAISTSNTLTVNDIAQLNTSVYVATDAPATVISNITNPEAEAASYSLELSPRTEADSEIFSRATVEMSMSEALHEAWRQGGCSADGITTADADNHDSPVVFSSPANRLDNICMTAEETAAASFRFIFDEVEKIDRTYTLYLIQRDSNGMVAGGQTFEIRPADTSVTPIEVRGEALDDGGYALTADLHRYADVRWSDSNNNLISHEDNIIVYPVAGASTYHISAVNPDGKTATGKITIDVQNAIKAVTASDDGGIRIELSEPAQPGTQITVSAINTGETVAVAKMIENATEAYVLIPDTTQKYFLIRLYVNGRASGERKIRF